MDLENKESINNALKGVHTLIHVASPIGAQHQDYDAYVRPAREGATAFVEASKANGVKKIVVTSSALTLMKVYGAEVKEVYDENDFVEVNKVNGYSDSKIVEESIFNDFARDNKDTEVVILNPGLILGPSMLPNSFSSGQFMGAILNGQIPALADIGFPACDVREVAEAHLLAAFSGKTKSGQRFPIATEMGYIRDLAKILDEEYTKFGYNVTTTPNDDPEKMDAMFKAFHGKKFTVSNKLSQEVLGLQYKIPVRQQLKDLIESLAELGVIENKIKK